MPKSKVEQINDAFIEILTKENSRQYAQYIKSTNRELIDNIDDLSPSKVKQIVKNAKVNIDDIALLFMIQNAVLLIVAKQDKKKDNSLLPIIAIIGLYSLKNPKRFVRKIVKINKGVGLNAREKQAQAIIQGFKSDNAKILKDARRVARNQLDRTQLKSKVSRNMIRDLNKGIKEKKSIKEIKNSLIRKYNNLSNVERALDTELHAQSEYVRRVHSEALGYTHKTWKTQQDSRVRETAFHKGVANQRVPIGSDFRAGGLRAEQAGDPQLPPSDRIRCRCYLVYD